MEHKGGDEDFLRREDSVTRNLERAGEEWRTRELEQTLKGLEPVDRQRNEKKVRTE